MNTVTWVGMDVHARSTHAAAVKVVTGEVKRMRFGAGIEAPVAWLGALPGPVHACYEAGPTGFGLYRAAVAAGLRIDVIAPGKTPRGPSDRVKTDRKDAELLARLLIAGQLKPVTVPPAGVEAARELTRLHDACRRDLMSARHRVSKMLLRHGRVYPKPTTWKRDHRKWLAGQRFEEPTSELVYLDLLARVDWARFEKPHRLGSWLGLTPSLTQSGESSSSGSITKTGSTLARRLLIEAAWHYGPQPHVGPILQGRQAGQPEQILAISNKAQRRLHRVYQQMKARGKPHGVITVAVARELTCFLWAAATTD